MVRGMEDQDTEQQQVDQPVAPWRVVDGGCEEAAAVIGMAIAVGADLSHEDVRLLTRIQNDLIDATGDIRGRQGASASDVRLDSEYVHRLDRAITYVDEDLSGPRSVILPGGTPAASTLHVAHTVLCRTADVAHTAVATVHPVVADYLDRAADLLLLMARRANQEHGDALWYPGLTARLEGAELWEDPVAAESH